MLVILVNEILPITISYLTFYLYFSDIRNKILLLDSVNTISQLITRRNTLTTE